MIGGVLKMGGERSIAKLGLENFVILYIICNMCLGMQISTPAKVCGKSLRGEGRPFQIQAGDTVIEVQGK